MCLKNFWVNISYLVIDDHLRKFVGKNGLNLTSQIDLRDNEFHKIRHLERLKNVTGVDWTFEFDYHAINPRIMSTPYRNRLGEILWGSYLDEITSAIERLCTDDLVKEAILEGITTHRMEFRLVDNKTLKEVEYQMLKLQNGILYLETSPEKFWTNLGNYDRPLEALL